MWAFRNEREPNLKSFSISILDSLVSMQTLAAYLHFWAWLVVRVRKPYIVGITRFRRQNHYNRNDCISPQAEGRREDHRFSGANQGQHER